MTPTAPQVHKANKKPKTHVENLKQLLNVNIFNRSNNENVNNPNNNNNSNNNNNNTNSHNNSNNSNSNTTTLPKPWWYFTFPSFNLKAKEDSRQDRDARSSLPDNIKIITSNNDIASRKPLLLPPQVHKEMRHSVSGVECCRKKTHLLPSSQQLRPSSNHSSTSSKRRFELFGRMTSKLMTFSSISCPNESRCLEDPHRPSRKHPSVPKPPSSSLPAITSLSVGEKKHPHHPSTLILPFPNPPPPFLIQPSSSSSSNKNYGTIFSESEFALR